MSDPVGTQPAPKKKAAPKKPRAPAAHPKYSEMIAAAIVALKERNGSSRQKISKHVGSNYKVAEGYETHIKLALKRGVANGSLVQVKGHGASGSFKVAKKAVEAKKPAKKVVKKPAVKKPTAKKTGTPKKQTAKKATTPKKAGVKKATKPAAKKVTKPAAKKATKPAAKKTTKPAAKKATAKPTTKKATPKKPAPKKQTSKKPTKAAAKK